MGTEWCYQPGTAAKPGRRRGSYTVIVNQQQRMFYYISRYYGNRKCGPKLQLLQQTVLHCSGQTATLDASTSTAGSGTITGYQWVPNGVTNPGTGVTISCKCSRFIYRIVTNSKRMFSTSAPVVDSALSGALVGWYHL